MTYGLTPFALEHLGEILYFDLPEDGQNTTPGQTLGTIESIRKIHDLVSCITGTVLEVNSVLVEDPNLINDDPLGEGWLFRIELDNERDLASLMRVNEYKQHVAKSADSSGPVESNNAPE